MRKTAKRAKPAAVVKNLDPLNVNNRLYKQLGKLLDQLEDEDKVEDLTLRERIACMVAIGRLQVVFKGLRAEGDPEKRANVGSSVTKYTRAFTENAARGRKGGAGPSAAAAAFAEFDRDDGGDDDAA